MSLASTENTAVLTELQLEIIRYVCAPSKVSYRQWPDFKVTKNGFPRVPWSTGRWSYCAYIAPRCQQAKKDLLSGVELFKSNNWWILYLQKKLGLLPSGTLTDSSQSIAKAEWLAFPALPRFYAFWSDLPRAWFYLVTKIKEYVGRTKPHHQQAYRSDGWKWEMLTRHSITFSDRWSIICSSMNS